MSHTLPLLKLSISRQPRFILAGVCLKRPWWGCADLGDGDYGVIVHW